ncbi:MAG: TlpA family protein disulfide reductase, partial [Desulfobacteraceae bacterium]|nr:TlpA family protein disulfide reductase [Desulfobacteraceae bacterium]
FVMIAVSLQESAQVVRDFFQKYKLTFTALLDSTGEVGRWFGIRAIPTTYILDRDGKVLGAAMGARQWDNKDAIALFEYLADKEITNTHVIPKGSNVEHKPHERL